MHVCIMILCVCIAIRLVLHLALMLQTGPRNGHVTPTCADMVM